MPVPYLPDPLDLATLDPGVREFVGFLRARGFNTTDSGDGVTKRPDPDDETAVLPWPHVIIAVDVADLVPESNRLLDLLTNVGIEVEPGDIQATYDPAQATCAIIALVDDEDRYIREFKAPDLGRPS